MIIGKSLKPRCFKNISPGARGFYYCNNEKAWMNAELFEEYVRIYQKGRVYITHLQHQVYKEDGLRDASPRPKHYSSY